MLVFILYIRLLFNIIYTTISGWFITYNPKTCTLQFTLSIIKCTTININHSHIKHIKHITQIKVKILSIYII